MVASIPSLTLKMEATSSYEILVSCQIIIRRRKVENHDLGLESRENFKCCTQLHRRTDKSSP